MASHDPRALHHRLLADVHAALGHGPQPTLTLFAPCIGKHYNAELMVIGRAVNGWLEEFDLPEAGTEAGRNAIIQAVVGDQDADGDCPMAWVVNSWGAKPPSYNTKKSAFWRVIKQVAARLGIDGDDWSSHLAWSNLYKVSPAEGGNPGERLCRAQRAACTDLLRWELETFKPNRVLVLTGWNWCGELADGLGFEADSVSESELVEAVGRIGKAKVVVAKHPQGKPCGAMLELIEKGWG